MKAADNYIVASLKDTDRWHNRDPVHTALVQLLYWNRRCYSSAYCLHYSVPSITLFAPPTVTLSVPAKKA